MNLVDAPLQKSLLITKINNPKKLNKFGFYPGEYIKILIKNKCNMIILLERLQEEIAINNDDAAKIFVDPCEK